MTFAAIDWLMSLEPDWYSTIYAMLVATGQMLPALGLAIAAAAWLADSRRCARGGDPELWNDLGNLLLAFVMLWTYMMFSKLLLIWSGNLPEEISWYLIRSEGGWQWVGWLLAVFYFAAAFPAAAVARRQTRSGAAIANRGSRGGRHELRPSILATRSPRRFRIGPAFAALARPGGPRRHRRILVGLLPWQLQARPLTPPPIFVPGRAGDVASHA